MYRDLSVVSPRRRFSTGASAKFFYLAEAIARAYEPTKTQLSDLDRAYQSTGEYLVTCPEFDGLLISFRSFKLQLAGRLGLCRLNWLAGRGVACVS